jgi:hypothetical protein
VGKAGCLQWLALKELQCPRIEGAGYRGLKRGRASFNGEMNEE